MQAASTLITAAVGDTMEYSRVNVTDEADPLYGPTLVWAGHGGDGFHTGGAGYSGGGSRGDRDGQGRPYDYEGGTGGGDGLGPYGGSGSGQDMSSYAFTAFNLAPGAGGEGNYPYGGGGGGLLVDGEGPLGIVEPSQGQGFGGGGYSHHGGLPGVILMEVDSMDM